MHEIFPADAVDEVHKILRPEMGSRVLRAVLLLSEGDITRLRHFSDQAAKDSRDVLSWAETPPGNDEPKSYKELRAWLQIPPEDRPRS